MSNPSEQSCSKKSKQDAIEMMTTILGPNYQIIANGTTDPIILAKLHDEDLAPKNSVIEREKDQSLSEDTSESVSESASSHIPEKTTDDYIFQFYLGSLTIVGLFVLFRMIQKSK
jgi:hypothetical protein